VGEPFSNQKGLILGEVAVVKDEKKFRFTLQPLDPMRIALWKKPHVAGFKVIDRLT
jgi:hypothetical protein